MTEPIAPDHDQTIIYQGKPQSRYFVVPVAIPEKSPRIGSRVTSINPRTKETISAVCRDYFTYPWDQVPDSFCLLNYGISRDKLRLALEEKFPDFRGKEQVRFLMLETVEGENQHKD